MHYVLMFPRGENGWHVNMPLNIAMNVFLEDKDEGDAVVNEADAIQAEDDTNTIQGDANEDNADQELSRPITTVKRAQQNISVFQFYVNRLQVRPNEGMLHYFSRLFHQYLVDMYVKVEHRRLEFIRNNQGSLRTELPDQVKYLKAYETVAKSMMMHMPYREIINEEKRPCLDDKHKCMKRYTKP